MNKYQIFIFLFLFSFTFVSKRKLMLLNTVKNLNESHLQHKFINMNVEVPYDTNQTQI